MHAPRVQQSWKRQALLVSWWSPTEIIQSITRVTDQDHGSLVTKPTLNLQGSQHWSNRCPERSSVACKDQSPAEQHHSIWVHKTSVSCMHACMHVIQVMYVCVPTSIMGCIQWVSGWHACRWMTQQTWNELHNSKKFDANILKYKSLSEEIVMRQRLGSIYFILHTCLILTSPKTPKHAIEISNNSRCYDKLKAWS